MNRKIKKRGSFKRGNLIDSVCDTSEYSKDIPPNSLSTSDFPLDRRDGTMVKPYLRPTDPTFLLIKLMVTAEKGTN